MSKPTLDGIKQASFGALDKAKLMVGLKNSEQNEEESQSERSSSFVEEAADLICPELTFQQRLIGFAVCFILGCKYFMGSFTLYCLSWSTYGHFLFSRSYHLHVLQILYSSHRRKRGSIRLELFCWQSPSIRRFMVSLRSKATIQEHV